MTRPNHAHTTRLSAHACPSTVSVGALLIGALAPSDRDELLIHLDHCELCRDEVVLLAPVPGLLHRLVLDNE